VQNTTFLHH